MVSAPVSLFVHTGSAAAFVVGLFVLIAKRLDHLHTVAILNVRTGDLNAVAIIDLSRLDLTAFLFHFSSPPFLIILFYNNRTIMIKKYLLKKIFYGIDHLLVHSAAEVLSFTLTND